MEKTLEISKEYSQFLIELELKQKIEEKIRLCLDFMQKSLATDATPAFKDFWEAKNQCLELFKEKIPPRVRNTFWVEYVALSTEVKGLKDLLDEKSSFAFEQIKLAIDALENDFKKADNPFFETNNIIIPKESKVLQKQELKYSQLQNEINFLTNFAERINGLKNELARTSMRMKSKKDLFQRLKSLGDFIFPKRKERIKEMSEIYREDVEKFIKNHFKTGQIPYFALKEEIKALQGFAKNLTLQPDAFLKTRLSLSECWDQIKEKEKEAYQKQSEEREIFKGNFDQINIKIDQLKKDCSQGKISLKEADQNIEILNAELKETKLGPDDVKVLRRRLFEAKQPLEEKEKQRKEKEREVFEIEEKRKKESRRILLDHLLEILNQAESLALSTIVEKWEILLNEEKALASEGIDKAALKGRLDAIFDHIQEKRWQDLLLKNPSDLSSQLHVLLDERHKTRRKLKETIDEHRKLVGGSSLNLEESLRYQELIKEERMRLDFMETTIEEIEEKLFDIER